jgi:hypothetical protein
MKGKMASGDSMAKKKKSKMKKAVHDKMDSGKKKADDAVDGAADEAAGAMDKALGQ